MRRTIDREKIKAVQLELIELRREYLLKVRAAKRKLFILSFGGRPIESKKRCPRCGYEMEAEQFYIDKSRADGLSPWCIECKSRDVKLRYLRRKVA